MPSARSSGHSLVQATFIYGREALGLSPLLLFVQPFVSFFYLIS